MYLLEFESFVLNEGGKALTSVRSVSRDEALATIEDLKINLIPKLGFDWNENVLLIGSAGHKEKSHDIDLGIFGKDTHSIQGKLETLSDEVKFMEGLDILSFAWPIAGSGDHVQVDMIPVVDKKWTEFVYEFPDGSKYKSAHRNWMFSAILSRIIKDKKHDDAGQLESYTTYVFKLNDGMFKTKKSFIGKTKRLKKAEKESEELVTIKPKEFVKFLFGDEYTKEDVVTFEDVWHIMSDSNFKWKDNLTEIKKEYKTFLKRANLVLPTELT